MIGVLCARVRVEEKQLLAALAGAGVPAQPLPPATLPLPLSPSPSGPSLTSGDGLATRVVLDRCQNRTVAAAVLPVWRALGAGVLGAGIAATGDRLAVATALAAAGLPRPTCRLACSEDAALAALAEIGYPATLLPLSPGAAPAVLCDRDSAEAVLEHRAVLGAAQDAISLVQAGIPGTSQRATVVVVGGKAAGTIGEAALPTAWAGLAEAAAVALGADVIGVEVAWTADGPAIWDICPVPEFRGATPLGHVTVAPAIAELAVCRLHGGERPRNVTVQVTVAPDLGPVVARREVADGVALSA